MQSTGSIRKMRTEAVHKISMLQNVTSLLFSVKVTIEIKHIHVLKSLQ